MAGLGGLEGYHVVINHLNLKPGQYVEITGAIPEPCTDFVVTLGVDFSNLLLHLNPRFHLNKYVGQIMFCSLINNVWGPLMLTDVFPFSAGTDTSFTIKYTKEQFVIMLPTGVKIPFPVCVPLEVIPFMFFKNFRLKRLKIG
ncbi:galectin-1-like [Pyxicephalus adspersus]|uniref:galectin-1-like n=1 Tax=Pyxicephalus adspersus TaxID=30357 RepID=UPI003B58CE5E